jgi:hypothetical protein
MELFPIIIRIYLTLITVHPLIALTVVVAAFWFGGWLWGLPLLLLALAVYGPILALPFIFPEIARMFEKFSISK